MRILHVNKFFDLRDGTDIYIHNLMQRQIQDGHEAHVLATRAPGNEATPDARLFIERLDFSRSEGLSRDLRKGLAFVWNSTARRAMREAIKAYRPDIVHLHNIYHHLSTSVLAEIRAAHLPCVQTLHDYKLACPNYKMFTEGAVCDRCKGGRYGEAVRHRCLWPTFAPNVLAACEMGMTKARQSYERTVRTFICPSQFMADKMAAWGEPRSKMAVVPNAVEPAPRLATREGNYILFAGRLSPEKGVETLLRAAARVPELQVRIAGTGPEESRLRMLATELGAKNVVFLGFVKRAENLDLWERAQAFVVPSVWYENASIATLEAMTQGVPVIASRIGGLSEQVADGETGILVEPQDTGKWEQALRAFMVLDEASKERMALAARKRAAELFSWDGHMAKINKVYSEVCPNP